MIRKTFISVLISFFASAGFSQNNYWQQEVDYTINVTLNDKDNTLDGDEFLVYWNYSPQTLKYIYFHLWPNAYKDNSSAFAQQLVENGRLDYYNAKPNEHGEITGLKFQVDGKDAVVEADTLNPDIVKIYIGHDLYPGSSCRITTPFHVVLPKTFSRCGHEGQSYQISQWYPKPAVYDRYGWHPIPYLDQGEFYSEYGIYDVKITLPENYTVGATGDLQDDSKSESNRMNALDQYTRAKFGLPVNTTYPVQDVSAIHFAAKDSFPPSSEKMKTLHYHQSNIHDFAWFADKRFYLIKDNVKLESGKKSVDTYVMFLPSGATVWQHANDYINNAVLYYSKWIGDYPYNQATALQGALVAGGGMEYPNVTVIGNVGGAQSLDDVITHEVGHNWFYGIFGFNEREHPWMDEGINSYYENRYMEARYPDSKLPTKIENFIGVHDWQHRDQNYYLYLLSATNHIDQPMDIAAANYTEANYGTIVYYKTAEVMLYLENYLGTKTFDSLMHVFFEHNKFTHVYPEDMKKYFEEATKKNLDLFFIDELNTTEQLDYKITGGKDTTIIGGKIFRKLDIINHNDIRGPYSISSLKNGVVTNTIWYGGFKGKMNVLFPEGDYDSWKIDAQKVIPETNRKNNTLKKEGMFRQTEKLRLQFIGSVPAGNRTQLNFIPTVGYNNYDNFMVGLAFYNLSPFGKKFNYAISPMYSTGSGSVVGAARTQFNFYPKSGIHQISWNESFSTFNYNANPQQALPFVRLNSSLKFSLNKKTMRSPIEKNILIRNIYLDKSYQQYDSLDAPVGTFNSHYFVNQLQYNLNNTRILNPYNIKIQLENLMSPASNIAAATNNLKLTFELNYKISYAKKNRGLNFRLFIGDMIYANQSYNLNDLHLGATTGSTDYAFDQTFLGRSELSGFLSQQIMMNDGGMKYRTDILTPGLGVSSSWIGAINLRTTIPSIKILPLFLFADFGAAPPSIFTSYNLFQYDAGFGVNLFNGVIEINCPLIFSNDIRKNVNTIPNYDSIAKRILFTFNINRIDLFNLGNLIHI